MKRLLLLLLFGGAVQAAFSQIPGTISYQGILVDNTGAPVADGTHYVKFYFYDAPTAGNLRYSSAGTGSGNQVTTFKGMFTFIIGSGSPGNSPVPIDPTDPLYIAGKQFYVEVNADGVTLSPRIPLTTVPYAMNSQNANAIDGAGVVSGTIPDARLSTNLQDLADGSLTGSLVGPGVPAANITGALATSNFPNTGVTANSYGSATQVPVLTVDAKGRITAASTVASTATVSNVSGSAPISVTNGTTTPAISIAKATGAVDGYLSAADFTTFNNKIGPGTTFGGDLTGTHSTSTVAKIQGQNVSATVPTANQVLQFIGSTWTPQTIPAGTVTNVTGSAPISVATGTTTPAISISQASGGTNGYLSSADWTTFNGKQPALTVSNGLTLAGSALTLGGSLTGATTIAMGANNLLFTGSGNIGIGGASPTRAVIEQNGATGSTTAIFGGGTTGIGLGSSRPNIGFNTYFNAGGKSIAPGFGAHIDLDPVAGDLEIELSNANAAAANTAFTMNQAMMIKNSGNVGLGTATPLSRLSVNGGVAIGSTYSGTAAAAANNLIVEGSLGVGNSAPGYKLDVTGDVNFGYVGANHFPYSNVGLSVQSKVAGHYLIYGLNSTSTNTFFVTDAGSGYFAGNVGVGTSNVNKFDVSGAAAIGSGYAGVSAAPANGLIVQGKVGIGTATPSTQGLLHLAGSSLILDTNSAYGFIWQTANAMNAHVFRWSSNNALYVTNNGTSDLTGVYLASGATAWTSTSDRRLKENIRETSYGLETILKIPVHEYNFKSSKEVNRIGFIAQEVYPIIPEIVQKGDDGPDPGNINSTTKGSGFSPWGVDYSALTPVLVKSTQEQQKQIQEQQKQIETLNATVADLKAQLSKYEGLSAQVEELRKLIVNKEGQAPADTKSTLTGSTR